MQPYKSIPGPQGHWFWGHLRERRQDPLHFYMESVREFGPLVRFRMGTYPVVLVSEPALAHEVLLNASQNLRKGKPYDVLRILFGNGLLTSEGAVWKRQRKLMQPAFHRASLTLSLHAMRACVARRFDAIERAIDQSSDATLCLNASDEFMRLTLDIACEALFGEGITELELQQVSQCLGPLLRLADERALSIRGQIFPRWVPTRLNRETDRHIAVLDRIVGGIIDRKIAARSTPRAETQKDLLSLLLESGAHDAGGAMSREQLRDEVMTFILAGHETTANLLSWLFLFLGKNPEQLAIVKQEIQQTPQALAEMTAESFMGLKLELAFLQEALRLMPPAWVLAREASQDFELGGFQIKEHTIVLVSPYVLHRNPEAFPDPESFRPARFLDDPRLARSKSYIPFSDGPRNCIGQNFALLEALLLFRSYLEHWDLSFEDVGDPKPEPHITLRPGVPVSFRVQRRV